MQAYLHGGWLHCGALFLPMVETPLTIFYYSKRQAYYSKRAVNEFSRVAGSF